MFAPAASARRHDTDRHKAQIAARERHAREQAVHALPFKTRRLALDQWQQTNDRDGFYPATRQLNRFAEAVEELREQAAERNAQRIAARERLEPWSCDATVKAWAKRRADELAALAVRAASLDFAYCDARAYCGGFGIGPQELVGTMTTSAALARMATAAWWRRRGRRFISETIERAELAAGHVHRRAAVYVSDPQVTRGKEAMKRNRQLLLDLTAVNENGESFSLAELADRSTANMHLRFCEMIVRLRGLEAAADREGYVGVFVTWTLASRWHRRLAASGAENPHYDGRSDARAAQDALVHQWAGVRAILKKRGVQFFGMRVAEPHHDSTPHWHMLAFVKPTQESVLLDVMRGAALSESPDEPGAAECRFKVERIDKAKGGATCYVAKYVSKMTTGAGMAAAKERGADGVQREVGKPSAAATRARVWASLYRIRQFQFFGTPPVGLWRELRRLREPLERDDYMTARTYVQIEGARLAATAGDYARHAVHAGGMATPRAARTLVLWKEEREGLNAYGERVLQVRGVRRRINVQGVSLTASASDTLSRVHTWHVLTRRPVASSASFSFSRLDTAATGASAGGQSDAATAVQCLPADPAASVACEPEREARGPWTRINNCNLRGIITSSPDEPVSGQGGAPPPPIRGPDGEAPC
jgi:hypothetical protein